MTTDSRKWQTRVQIRAGLPSYKVGGAGGSGERLGAGFQDDKLIITEKTAQLSKVKGLRHQKCQCKFRLLLLLFSSSNIRKDNLPPHFFPEECLDVEPDPLVFF
jgi:hypothetical protein